MMKISRCGIFFLFLLLTTSVATADIVIDGNFSVAEWTGATFKSVLYNPSAPLGNFSGATNQNHNVAYKIYTTSDANFFYVGLTTEGDPSGGLNFANLYFDTQPGPMTDGSDVGFEVTNNQAFIPGGMGGYITTLTGITWAKNNPDNISSLPGVIELKIPFSFFTSDPLGMGFEKATTAVQLRLSQSFGYSVAGGPSYGETRLGQELVPPTAPVPEAASLIVWSVLTATLGGATWLKRRKQAA